MSLLPAFGREGSVGKYSIPKTFWRLEKRNVLFEEKSAQMFFFTKPVTHTPQRGRDLPVSQARAV